MSSSHDSDKRVYLMKSVVLTFSGVIFSGGVLRVDRTVGNRGFGGDRPDAVGLVMIFVSATYGTDLQSVLLRAFLARFFCAASASFIS